ncbi:hypothetical protein ACWDF9_25620 [Streptomyces rubiginosohelvolus]
MIKEGAERTGPDGKDDMLYSLVTTLTKAEGVPSQLRDAFRDIQALAS